MSGRISRSGMSSLLWAIVAASTSASVMVGDHEVFYKPDVVLERAKRLLPNIEAELVQNGGHLLPVDQCDAVNRRILQFLGKV